MLDDAFRNQYSGRIEVNFFKGSITNVNREESFKPPSEYKEIILPKKMAETLKNGGY